MRLLRLTTRRLMVLIAIVALCFAWYAALIRALGPRPGFHKSPYHYLDRNLRWQVVRGAVIYVNTSGMIFVD
jgi:hypothetical protein